MTTQVVVDGVVVATTRRIDLFDPKGYATALALLESAAGTLPGPPSVARIRAALILLEGMTDDTLVDVTADVRARLTEVLDAVDDGTI